MADAGLPAPPVPPAAQVPAPQLPPVQPVKLPVPPNQPVPTQQIQHMLQVNWSHFKPELVGKLDEDAENISEQMIGRTHMHFKKVSKSSIFSCINRRS